MPNDYFVPGYDDIDQFGRRRFMPPPVRPPQAPQLRPMPAMIGQPELQGGMEENAVPQEMQVERMGPPPVKPLSRAEQWDEVQKSRPKPVGMGLRAIQGLQRGGVMGVLGAVLDRDAPKREQFEADQKAFQVRSNLEHLDKQDELNDVSKRAYAENINSQVANRKALEADRAADNERQIRQDRWVDVAPGELQETPEDGKPGRYEYGNVGGKMRKRLTDAAVAQDKKEAEQVNWREVPPKIAEALGLAVGTKVPPNEMDGYVRMVEAREQKTADREQRAALQREAVEARKALASIAASVGAGRADFRNTMQMNNAYKAEKPVQAMYDVKQAYESMASAGDDGPGDVTLMRLFAKITDPSTGVREEEYKTMQNAGGVMNAVNVFTSGKWVKGQRLSPETRAAFLRIGKQILQNREKAVKPIQEKYRKQASRFGVDPDMVIAESIDAEPPSPPKATHRFNAQTGRIEEIK